MTEKMERFLKNRGSPFSYNVMVDKGCPSDVGLINPSGFCKNQNIVSKENCKKCWLKAERQL